MHAAGAQERNKCCGGSFLCLIEVGILSSSLFCATWVQLQWLRPLVAPVSSSAPGREDCPALIPVLIIFKAAGIYITLMQAPVALQHPQEAAFLAFSSIAWWAEIATMDVNGRHRSIWPASWIWMFSRFVLFVHIQMVSTFAPQQLYKVIHEQKLFLLFRVMDTFARYILAW